MNNTCHHQMSQIVGFKIQTIGKCTFLVLTSYFGANYRLLLFVRMSVNPLILFLDDDRGMDVTVRTLGFHHMFNEVIHQFIQFGIFRDGIHGSHPFHPFIHITVMKGRSPMFALANTGSYFKVTEAMRNIGIVPCVPHTLQGGMAIYIETVAPKAICPMHGT